MESTSAGDAATKPKETERIGARGTHKNSGMSHTTHAHARSRTQHTHAHSHTQHTPGLVKGELAREHGVQSDAHCPHSRGRAQIRDPCRRLVNLGGRVDRRARCPPNLFCVCVERDVCEAKVPELDVALLRDVHVGGLDVQVNHPLLVAVLESIHKLPDPLARQPLADRPEPVSERTQRSALLVECVGVG